MRIERLGDIRTTLGEGPYWDTVDQRLFFVDIKGRRIWRFDPATADFRGWDTPVEPSAISRVAGGGLVAVLGDGFYAFDPDGGRFAPIAMVDTLNGAVQINDAKVDRQGRFVGGGAAKSREPIAPLYSFDGQTVTTIDVGFTICNGPCWSVDGGTFYIADTIPNKLYAYDYDAQTGVVANKRLLADCSDIGGFADGATVDAAGRIWMAFCGQGKIACFNPDGSIDRILHTEVQWVSSVQFGGPNLDRLYVTSFDPAAAVGRPPDDNSGYLYVIDGLGATGLAEPLGLSPSCSAIRPAS
ncbi:SMP-30/gluconolactonase/LRE family protein [Sphingobium sp.]|uniref:SMP-30/gluconolactonase/LRE family protein n=1 Tax=Sphingobium sp. TaxID=1912891 RepID=UPI002BAF29AB|nr:SMP-30/gluconolactonase/LRE family protein [Sphingobium sp.]HUD94899.1 SMP-30/gluconolactonase/LRE family protein [Sphingobium sp.]